MGKTQKEECLIKKAVFLAMAALLLLSLLGGCGAPKTMQVYCFDAGKADAFLLWTDGGAILIDAGESGFGEEILTELAARGVEKLDYLILTHFDQDHIGGAAAVLRGLPVGQVLQSDCPKESDEYADYVAALAEAGLTAQTLRQATAFELDGAQVAVDPPAQTGYDENDSNNSSLIVSVTYGEKRFLFTGDAQEERLEEFLAGGPGAFDFLKVPYHGHWQKRLADLIGETQPAYAVITSSQEEKEDDKTVSALEDAGAAVFLTRKGAVLAVCDGKSLTVTYAEN